MTILWNIAWLIAGCPVAHGLPTHYWWVALCTAMAVDVSGSDQPMAPKEAVTMTVKVTTLDFKKTVKVASIDEAMMLFCSIAEQSTTASFRWPSSWPFGA